MGELFAGTGSLLWIKSARMGIPWIATAVLAVASTQEQIGVYHVALRISLVSTFADRGQ